jgi:Flp pilus assembly protein TadD
VAATYRQALADGQGNMERGAHLAAVADYRRALSARSTGEAWFGLGQALAEAGRPDEARQAFRRSLEAEPEGPHAGEAVRAMLRLR